MRINPQTGLLAEARQVASPNCDARPPGTSIDLIVIHGISLPPGEFGGPWIDALFSNRLDPKTHPFFLSIQGLKVSSHVLIRRDGEVVQYVPFHRRAWHAGVSSFQARERCNDFSIGIELEGTDCVPYTDDQYGQLAALIRTLTQTYPGITPERITGHANIAPGRKTDPGPAFEWSRLHTLLSQPFTTSSATPF